MKHTRIKNSTLHKTLFITTLLLSSGFIHAETAEADAVDKGMSIAVESDKRDSGFSDQTANMVMELRNKHGDVSTRTIRLKTLEVIGDGDKSMSIFES